MRLITFRVTNYRSVNDSGDIEVRSRTALVGRNESGKTNLLLALQAIKPVDGGEDLSFIKDFPRDRHRSEFSDNLPVVTSTWELDTEEQAELTALFPRAKGVEKIQITRLYKPDLVIEFLDLLPIEVDDERISAALKRLTSSVTGSLKGKEPEVIQAVTNALSDLQEKVRATDNPRKWGETAKSVVNSFRQAVLSQSIDLTEKAQESLIGFEDIASAINQDKEHAGLARKWVTEKLPIFMYLSEYPVLEGHQSIQTLVDKINQNQSLDEAERNFMKLMKVAGLDPAELQRLLTQDHEYRQQLSNRAGAVVTKKLRELWTDRPLKVRFNLDAHHFDTLVSNPAAEVYDVEVNLNERSRGFKWFFSFYVTFAADTAGGEAENAILLLDEPGLFLHAVAQRDLLEHFAKDFSNQIIYTTHSPFMVPVDDLGSVRTVNIGADEGTTVTNDPTGDEKTLFPLQTALGYDLTQTLFVGDKTLVVEGISDFWYLSSVSEYLKEVGGTGLPDIVLTPAGGAQKVSYMVSLLAAQNLKVLVLFDDEPQAKQTADDIIKAKLIRKDYVIFVSEGLQNSSSGHVDVEDLVDPDVYEVLVRESYEKELGGLSLQPNEKIPRLVTRYEKAFEDIGLKFNKTRPARLFIRRIADSPSSVVTEITQQNFERLFKVIEGRLNMSMRRDNPPFL